MNPNRVPTILAVDDDRSVLRSLADVIQKEGYELAQTSSPKEALDLISSRESEFDLVLTDLRMGEIGGMQILDSVRGQRPDVPVIVLTAFADMDSAVEAIRKGAYDFLSKPFKLDHLRMVLRRALEQRTLKRENLELRSAIEDRQEKSEIVGSSPEMVEVFKLVARVAPLPTTLLIQGESGTGKEMVAQLTHAISNRKGPFRAVNCGALTETLLESELFGYVKGAFTGATTSRRGLFEACNGGTCFLDEIANTTSGLQMKLLRVLEEREVVRVGSTEPIPVDVRIIAATNQRLSDLVEAGSFREDLFYRLKVVTIDLPLLRERRGDIPLLLDHFVREHSKATSKRIAVHESVYGLLAHYEWPGNVRELENAVERAIALNSSGVLTVDDFGKEIGNILTRSQTKAPSSEPYKSLRENEAEYVQEVLEFSGQNVTRAAEILGIDRRTVYRILERQGIERS
jgi:DNA-binding NtrC family response regulator